jgi:hypothetical protein
MQMQSVCLVDHPSSRAQRTAALWSSFTIERLTSSGPGSPYCRPPGSSPKQAFGALAQTFIVTKLQFHAVVNSVLSNYTKSAHHATQTLSTVSTFLTLIIKGHHLRLLPDGRGHSFTTRSDLQNHSPILRDHPFTSAWKVPGPPRPHSTPAHQR